MSPCRASRGGVLRGRAILCFPPHAEWFQGYFFPSAEPNAPLRSNSSTVPQWGLFGTEQPVDACEMCPDGGFQIFHVVVSDFDTQQGAEVEVHKRGGELCRLESAEPADDGDDGHSPSHSHGHSHGDGHSHSDGHRHGHNDGHSDGHSLGHSHGHSHGHGYTRLRFETQVLLTDARAVAAIRSYFPTIAAQEASDEVLADCAVCVGDMQVQSLEFQPASH